MRISRPSFAVLLLLNPMICQLAAQQKGPEKQPAKDAANKPAITAIPRISPKLHDLLQSRQFAAAIETIDQLLQTDAPEADYLLYLKGRALTENGQLPLALQTFTALEKQHPDSRWLARSRFGRADVLVRRRDYRAAGLIYQDEARRLLSAGRKNELVGIYLEFADHYFEGVPAQDPSSQKKPDFKQALTYYQEALKSNPTLQIRQRVEFRIARCQQELNKHAPAAVLLQKFLKQYASEQTSADRRVADELQLKARYQLGRAQLAAGQKSEARKTWQDFLADDAAQAAGGELLQEVAYRLAHTYGIPAPPTVGDMELGVVVLQKFLKAYPKHKLAPQAELEIAQSYGAHVRFDQAVAQLKQLIANKAYADTPQIPEARFLLGQAYAAQTKFTDAIAAWREFLNQHPTNRHWSNVQRVVIDAEYAIGLQHLRNKKYPAARKSWETFLNQYPLDNRAPGILFRFGQMKYAQAHELERDRADDNADAPKPLSAEARKLFEQAMLDWNRLVSKHPKSNEASRGAYSIGITLEDQLGRLPEALEAYEKVKGQFAARAKQRIAKLTANQLELLTERKYRSNEKPAIKLTTRNLETVTISIYRIDMVDYFRKMHLATGVESLDIALIDPDKTWEYEVGDYEKYRRLENKVEIPVDEPGVTAVTVSSKKQQATTMVIVSDLDIIVKNSRNELFVFAQNVRTGKPAADVRLLISDGREVFAEASTAEDGVLQKSYKQLKTARDLRIFAINEGHAASTVSSLNGLDFAVGLAPKGYLYTDRPAYRAGQLVNIKGILRWVADDQYTFKPGAAFQLDVYDARGRVIHSNKVELNTFGTFADHFLLPAASAQGDYRIHVHQALSKQSYETTFAVHEYKLEPVRISVDLPRTVYFRGETIEGKIAVKYYYGTPLAGKTVRYRLSDDRIHTATTDDKGEIAFQFETRRYSETQQLQLHVEFPERNLATVKPVHLATRGFAIAASTLRKVYIAGETFDVTVNVSDPSGKPVATDLKLEVLERVAAGQTRLERQLTARAGERLIQSRKLKSAEKDGAARHTVRIDKPGTYILRASGTDRFDNPVSGSHTVTISGDEDKIRLRLLADQHHFKVGDTGKVQIHWRDAPALALVTYEGASILGYRLIPLKKGANAIEIPMDSKLAPNFDLAVAVMDANRFHQARSQFRVSRRLQVTLKTNRNTLKPGDELRVEITTTNPQGKPISAELSLGLIQQNLIDIIGDRQSDIQGFFAGGSRKVSVRAASSCTFRYRPSTRAISQTLLAEADRVRQIQEELVARRDLDAAPANGPGGADDGTLVLRGGANDIDELARVLAEVENLDDDLTRLDRVITGPLAGRRASAAGESQSAVPNFSYNLSLNFKDSSANSPAQQASSGAGGAVVTNGRARLAPGVQSMQRQQVSGFASGGVAGQRFGRSDRNQLAAEGRSSSAAQIESIDVSGSSRFSTTWGWNGQTELSRPGYYKIPQAEHALQSQRMVDFFDHISNSGKSVVALNQRGEFQVLNGLKVAALQDMAREGMQLLPGMGSAETAYWNPVVVTDKRGKASVTFRLPDHSTAWKLRAKGADVDVLAGSADARIITKRNLFGELKTPLAFTAGDKATVLVEVHNSVVKKGKPIQVRLKTTVGEKSTQITRSFKSDGPGIKELSIPIEVPAGDSVAFELTISSGELIESSSRDVVVRPHGVPVFATASGSANQSTIAFVEHDQGLPIHNSELEILVGPSVNRTLLDAVLGGGISRYESSLMTPRNGFERSISDVLGGVALLKMIGQTRQTDAPDALALAGRVTAAISQIVSSQRDDGGWSWSGRPAAASDRFITSRVVWAFSVARKAGFAVPNDTFNKAVQSLKTAFTKSAQSDREGQAIILHGLAEAGAADFALANRLYRERNSLSPSGLLHVALVLSRLDRKSMANDLLQIVDVPLDQKLAQRSIDTYADRCLPWMQTGVELRALYLLALEEIAPADATAAKVADWLLAARRGARWSPEKANGPAVTALARWFAGKQRVNEKYTLAIVVNNRLVETLKIDPSVDPSRRVQVPADALIANEPQQIHFNIEGRGRFSYSVVMSGFVAADKLKNTTNKWSVTRTYEPAKRMLDGKDIPRGFNILTGSYTAFRNPLTQLPLGERGEVTLHVRRHYSATEYTKNQWDYLVLTEPIPAGTMVLTESINGKFERYEISPGAITFYLGDERSLSDIHYSLVGYLPGSYRTVPSVVRSFYRPERIAVSQPKSLDILGRGGKTRDAYRLTPVELYEFGRRMAAKREYPVAREHLVNLFKNWRLNGKVYKHVVQMLFRAALETDNHQEIVEYFEIIKEKYADIELDFESILKVAHAYRELGEYERGYLVFRATIEAAFQRESQIAGFLDKRGEFLRSVQVMERLLNEYPAESYIATATFALAGEVYGKAAEAAKDAKLRKAGIGRVDLVANSIQMFDHLISTWPLDPAADQAGFSLASSLLDLEQYQNTIDRCEGFAKRYPDSELLDSFWYMIGYSRFALGQHDKALTMCRKVAESLRKNPRTGLEQAAKNKWQAIYIMGQIYHSLGQPARAIAEYTRVKERFSDATEAIDFFTRRNIALPEVTTIKPGDDVKFALKFRNVAEAGIKVYRIDLLKFGLLQRNLDRITAINLAGIRPYHELNLKLGNGKDYRDREQVLTLPLKDEGAYLVVCRGENLYASGLVLVSPLALEVQEDRTSGRVRVTVKDTMTEQYADDVHVKVIGSSDDAFTDGETDLRGIFVADAIQGTSTIIAKSDQNRYAFYRGKIALGKPPADAAKSSNAAKLPPPTSKGGKGELLKNLIEFNGGINTIQRGNYRQLLDNEKSGVQAKEAF